MRGHFRLGYRASSPVSSHEHRLRGAVGLSCKESLTSFELFLKFHQETFLWDVFGHHEVAQANTWSHLAIVLIEGVDAAALAVGVAKACLVAHIRGRTTGTAAPTLLRLHDERVADARQAAATAAAVVKPKSFMHVLHLLFLLSGGPRKHLVLLVAVLSDTEFAAAADHERVRWELKHLDKAAVLGDSRTEPELPTELMVPVAG